MGLNSMPKISIIMPVYNSAEYLKEAINSILNQTLSDWEFIIINEFGSNDGSKEIIEEYAKVDKRFILIQNEIKLGISASMNRGIDIACGDYIARMDADDISLPKRFEKQVNFLEQNPTIGAVGLKPIIFGEENWEWNSESDSSKIATEKLFFLPMLHPTVMYKKDILDKYNIRYNPLYTATEDYDLFCRLSEVCELSNISSECLFKYRRYASAATYKNKTKGDKVYLEVMERNFKQVNLFFTPDELQLLYIHQGLVGLKGKVLINELTELDLLLKKILIANIENNYWGMNELFSTLHNRWMHGYYAIITSTYGGEDFIEKNIKETISRSIFYQVSLFENYNIINNSPKVSVLMPVYNGEKYLFESIKSIQDQTFKNWEFVIVNDASTDNTPLIVKEFAKYDKRIKLYTNDANLKIAKTLNRGIELSKGEYIARMDDDDIAYRDRLEKEVNYLDLHKDISLVGTYQNHFGNYEWIHAPYTSKEEMKVALLFSCDICHSTVMFRKNDFISNNLLYDHNKLSEDYDLWTRASHQYNLNFATIPEILGDYRVNGENITSGKTERFDLEAREIVSNLLSDYLHINLKDDELILLAKWTNPFIDSQVLIKKELDLFDKIRKQNKKYKVYNEKALETILSDRYNWMIGNEKIISNNRHYKSIKLSKVIIKKIKSLIIKLSNPFVIPIRQQLWDLDGHIYDYKDEITNLIKKQDNLKEIESVIHKTENKILDEFEKKIDKIVQSEVKVVEEIDLIKKQLNDQFRNVENNIINKCNYLLDKIDDRIRQSEIYENEKLWSIEGKLENYDKNTINLIETQLMLFVESEFKKNKIPYVSGEKIKVAFLFQVASFWSSFESIWKLLKQDDRFEVTMLLFDNVINETTQMLTAREFLIKNGIDFLECYDYDFDKKRPHIVFMQTPYDEWHRPKWLWSSVLKSKGIRIAYISYGFEITDSIESKKLTYDNEVVKNAWRYYTSSDIMKRKFQDNCSNGGYSAKVVGHTKLDSLYISDKKQFINKIHDRICNRKTIVWLMHFPHHTEVNGEFFMDTPSLEEYLSFSENIQYFDNLFFIVRPHPKFFEMSKWIEGGTKLTNQIKNNILNSSNAYLDQDDEYHSMLKCGDAFIVDASALAIEVAALNKPVLYMKNKENPIEINEVYKPIIECYVQGETYVDIKDYLNDFISEKFVNMTRDKIFNKVIPYYDGKCAERIRMDLLSSLFNDY